MKKMLAVLAVMSVLVSVMLAGDIFTFPVFTQSASTAGEGITVAPVWTNQVGERVILKSVWMSCPTLTNGTFKLLVSTAITNDLPATLTGTTLYFMPEDGALMIEPAGKIIFSGLLSTSNSTAQVSVYVSRPDK